MRAPVHKLTALTATQEHADHLLRGGNLEDALAEYNSGIHPKGFDHASCGV